MSEEQSKNINEAWGEVCKHLEVLYPSPEEKRRRRMAIQMHWTLNAGFVLAIVGAVALQSPVALAIGAAVMLVPMAWITMKEGL